MKTLTEQYRLIKEDKGHKDVFLKEAKQKFPNLIKNNATFNEASTILKQKNIISDLYWVPVRLAVSCCVKAYW